MLEFFLLPFIFAFGIITSIEDLKRGKIKNIYIGIAIILALINYGSYLQAGQTGYNYFISSVINAVFALILGFALWSFNAITAGDSKLFFAYSLLVPLSVYRIGYINYFPSLTLLINTFVPIFLFLFIKLMIITDRKEKFQIMKSTFTSKNIATFSLFFFGFTWLIQSFFLQIGIKLDFIFQLFLLLSALLLIRKYLRNHFFKIIIAASILRIVFDYTTITTTVFWINLIPLILLFLFLMGFVTNLGEFMFNQAVNISELKPGMIPVEAVVKKGRKYVKTSLSKTLLSSKEYLIDYKPSGLTRHDIELMQSLAKSKKLAFDSLIIQQTIPFAPLLFIGVLLTFISQGNFIEFLKMLVLTNIFNYTVIFK